MSQKCYGKAFCQTTCRQLNFYSSTQNLKHKLQIVKHRLVQIQLRRRRIEEQKIIENAIKLIKRGFCYGLFGSLEREESRGEQREGEQWRGEQSGMIPLHLVWIFLKLVRGNGVINHFSCLDVLKIRIERRGND